MKIIITLMSLAVVGLIAVQLYWIINVVQREEKKFSTEVSDALSVVVENLERNEAAEFTIEKILRNENLIIKLDDKTAKEPEEIFLIDSTKRLIVEDSGKFGFEFHVGVNNTANDSVKLKTWVMNKKGIGSYYGFKNEEVIIQKQIDSIYIKKSKLVEDVVNQIIIAGIDTTNTKFDAIVIDSLLNEQLNRRGIATEYYFGIRKSAPDSFVYIQNHASKPSLKNSTFSIRLYEDELFREPNFLTVYFPNQKSYILKSISVMLSISALLIVVIVGVFFKTVQLLVRQKKITEIKSDLINNITHEFKTPISTISLACEALNEPRLMNDKTTVAKYTNIIKEENSRLGLMVETILNNAAIEKGDYKLSVEEVDVHELISDLIDIYRKIIEDRGGVLLINLNAQYSRIETDKFHLTNIINNLLDNAIKYSPENPKVAVSTKNDSKNMIITVEDNGIGISKKDQKRIFETFFRVHKGNIHDVKGYGIGLSYVKKMIFELGGTIELRSKLNVGSIFEISLPVKTNED